MEGGEANKKSAAITLDQFVSNMTPLINLEKVLSFVIFKCSFVIYLFIYIFLNSIMVPR